MMRCHNPECQRRSVILFSYAGKSYCLPCKRKKLTKLIEPTSVNVSLNKKEVEMMNNLINLTISKMKQMYPESQEKAEEIENYLKLLQSTKEKLEASV